MALLACALLAACSGSPKRHPVPRELTNDAMIPGLPGGRQWGDSLPTFQVERLKALSDEQMSEMFPAIYGVQHHYLAISGGGPNGAYGAGMLKGWSERGDRPEFAMVTGVSTGALSAPYAFMGSDYDKDLERLYTTTSTEDLVEERGIFGMLFGESVMKTDKLRKVIEKNYDAAFIDLLAAEHRRGRRLFVGTVNLDAGRPVIWNITEIAASEFPGKVELIHDILQASSAIPVAFPPVMIDVEVNGETYDEMHVDGGTASQVFVYPASVDWDWVMERLHTVDTTKIYVVRNAFLAPDFQGVNRSLMPIAGRSIDSLIRTQGIGDLYQIHAICQRDGNAFHLAYIPETFTLEAQEAFDPVYMSALFELGYQEALAGYPWKKTPPGYTYVDQDDGDEDSE